MTDTDRIDDLEREVAELSEYIRQLQRTNTALGEIMRGVPPMPAPLNTGAREYMTCAMCGTQTAVGLWHICSPPFGPFTNVGVTS